MSGHDLVGRTDDPAPPNPPSPYVELGLMTAFSFGRGASDALELILRAYDLGYDAIGVTDLDTLSGIVRMHVNAREAGMRVVIGARLAPVDAPELLVYPRTRAAYGRLTRLISAGRDRAAQTKGKASRSATGKECRITLADVAEHAEGLVIATAPVRDPAWLEAELPRLAALPLTHVAAAPAYGGEDAALVHRLDALARAHGATLLATNDVLYAYRAKRPLADVLTCIRERLTIAEAGFRLEANGERHLKSPSEMMRLFDQWPHAIRATREIADACRFSLDELKYEYPQEPVPEGWSDDAWLRQRTYLGAAERYPNGTPADVRATIEKELALIARKGIARYFLTVRDLVAFARDPKREILCQGRGSAANSAVCYCLGVTNVDPSGQQVLFERFLSMERDEPPDIDIDFEHERREEVIQHVYERYGRDRAGLCATVIHYRPRMAIREVGRVMGLSEHVTAAMAKTVWGSWGTEVGDRHVREAGLDPDDPHLRRTVHLASELVGLPRHLSQHVGGFVLTQSPLVETVPIRWGAMPDRSYIEWDKDDIEHLGIFKVDVLALGMLTAIAKCLEMIAREKGETYDLASIPPEVEGVYDMLCQADSLGVFQIESRAQMAMLPRLKPRCFYDLVIEVAIVRPGPIQGDMVHPYMRNRDRLRGDPLARIDYPRPGPEHPRDELEKILKRTLGVPIFQEQAMSIAMHAARFTGEEANQLRRAMATFRSCGTIEELQDKMVGQMIERGYDPTFAQRCFDQIKGFGEYGFPESHAASFAHLVYVSSWIKWAHPDVFAAGLLNSQPMGFYAPAQIVRDARDHGVEVRAPDVNLSDWDCTLEPLAPDGWKPLAPRGLGEALAPRGLGEALAPRGLGEALTPRGSERAERRPRPLRGTGLNGVRAPSRAVRLGLRLVDGFGDAAAATLMAARDAPFESVADLHARTRLPRDAIEALAAADAFRSMGLDRRQALWDVRALADAAPNALADMIFETRAALPAMPASEHVVADYQTLRLSLKAHPLSFLRACYAARGLVTAADMRLRARSGRPVTVAGLVLVRQRPGSAKGVCFLTLEDETGVTNVVVWPKVMEANRRTVMAARLMHVRGRVQRTGEGAGERAGERADQVIHLVAESLIDATGDLALLSEETLVQRPLRHDHVERPLPSSLTEVPPRTHPRDVRIIPKLGRAEPVAPEPPASRPVPPDISPRLLPKAREFH